MTVRLTVAAAVVAATAAVVAAPAAAHAGPNDNAGATVSGVTAKDASADCPGSHFCIYTGPAQTGKVFQLYRCETYTLRGWNGIGSYMNWNADGARAYILGKNREVLTVSKPDTDWHWDDEYDFKPAYYV